MVACGKRASLPSAGAAWTSCKVSPRPKLLPSPGALATSSDPPIIWQRRKQIDKPSPVPVTA